MKKRINGKVYNITRSDRKDKKYKVLVNGKYIHFGARGYRIKPGTKAQKSYCARSGGIKGKDNINSANYWSRLMWKC